MKKDITRLFCLVDDFLKALEEERKNKQIEDGKKRRKPTKGWFFGFKLHIIIDDKGNLINAKLTKGNVDDRSVVPQMTANMKGFLFADKGYISKDLFLRLMARGLKIITGIKRSMKNILMSFEEKILLRKRSLVETVFDYLKNKFMLKYSRHRSCINMLVHIILTLTAYQLKSTKPSFSAQPLSISNP